MTARWRCWDVDSGSEEHGLVVDDDDACDPEEAAEHACELWELAGAYAGDPMPDMLDVRVRDMSSGVLFAVEVHPEYDVHFEACEAMVVEKQS